MKKYQLFQPHTPTPCHVHWSYSWKNLEKHIKIEVFDDFRDFVQLFAFCAEGVEGVWGWNKRILTQHIDVFRWAISVVPSPHPCLSQPLSRKIKNMNTLKFITGFSLWSRLGKFSSTDFRKSAQKVFQSTDLLLQSSARRRRKIWWFSHRNSLENDDF